MTATRKSPLLYARIEQDLRAEIEAGAYGLGDCLPGEHALCERFGVSRFTIRQAIRQLCEEGLVAARPGIGTVVVATRRRDAFVQTLHTVEELLQYPEGTLRNVLAVGKITAAADLAARLECPAGTCWVWLRAMRHLRSSQLPISWLDAWVLPRFADVLDRPNPQGAPLLRQIEETHGHIAARSQVAILAGTISAEQAGHLQAVEGSAALIIQRRYRGADGETYLVTHSTHPEGRFSLNFDFEKR